jgi:hypothetical protein
MTHFWKIELRSAMILFTVLSLATLLAVPALPGQEITWGGTVDGTGSGTIADHLDEPDSAFSVNTALWLRSLFTAGDGGSTYEVEVQPSYTWTDDRPYLFDLDRAKLDVIVPGFGGSASVLRATVGRFRAVDASGQIFSHTLDGADITWSHPVLRARVGTGYTGLILNPVSGIRMSGADDADSGDDEVFWGPPRYIVLSEITLPGLILRQSVTAAYIGQWDLRDADEEQQEDTLDSNYFGVRIDGPLASGLFQDIGFYLSPSTRELAGEKENDLGILGSARVRYFRPDWNSSRFAIRGVVVSGAGNKEDNFYTISGGQAGLVSDIPLENIAYGEATYGVRPFAGGDTRMIRDIQTGIYTRKLCLMSDEQPIDSFGAVVSDDGRYAGTEVSVNVGWRALSDLGTSITAGAFWPGTGSSGAFTNERKPEYLLRMKVSASF